MEKPSVAGILAMVADWAYISSPPPPLKWNRSYRYFGRLNKVIAPSPVMKAFVERLSKPTDLFLSDGYCLLYKVHGAELFGVGLSVEAVDMILAEEFTLYARFIEDLSVEKT